MDLLEAFMSMLNTIKKSLNAAPISCDRCFHQNCLSLQPNNPPAPKKHPAERLGKKRKPSLRSGAGPRSVPGKPSFQEGTPMRGFWALGWAGACGGARDL